MTKSEDETLATLDVACINLFTGELELLKAGAGASLLLSKTRVSRLDESSLPLGILRELTFTRTRDRLVDGDILLLMSDGISNDGTRWVEELLRTFDIRTGSVQTLSNIIVETAGKFHKEDKGDDMTVIAIKIEKADMQDIQL
jgi:stage II sporulation protein E